MLSWDVRGMGRVARRSACGLRAWIARVPAGALRQHALPVEKRGQILRAAPLAEPPDVRRTRAENALRRRRFMIARRREESREQPASQPIVSSPWFHRVQRERPSFR